MIIPFSVEHYVRKAKKKGFSTLTIRAALSDEEMWNKVLYKNWKFEKAFDYFLNMIEDGGIEKKKTSSEMVMIYKKSI